MDAIAPGGLGGTYAGSPIACAAALAVMKVFDEEKLLERSQAVGEKLKAGLREIAAKHKVIGDVRGLGSMVAIELFENGDHDKPAAELVGKIVARAREKGLILLSCGTYYNVIRLPHAGHHSGMPSWKKALPSSPSASTSWRKHAVNSPVGSPARRLL